MCYHPLRASRLTKCYVITTLRDYLQISYKIRYIKRPTPIILTDLSSLGLTIDGISTPTDCILDESMHAEIVQRAVELAKMSYDSQNVQENIIQAGARTE